jgi:hypothetical protein
MAKQLSVSVCGDVQASAEAVYTILADYRQHHPQILPAGTFTRLVVEEGGIGAGTVFQAELKAFGRTQNFRMCVTEPEPGRILAESDLDKDLVTTFTVTPLDAARCSVTIATTWQASAGIAGWIEGMTMPPYLKRVYSDELAQLDRYAQSFKATEGANT